MRGEYRVGIPAIVERQDVLSPEWPSIRQSYMANLAEAYNKAFDYLETKIAQKKRPTWKATKAYPQGI